MQLYNSLYYMSGPPIEMISYLAWTALPKEWPHIMFDVVYVKHDFLNVRTKMTLNYESQWKSLPLMFENELYVRLADVHLVFV